MSTKSDRKLLESLENHAATINRTLEILEIALQNADSPRLQRKILNEIDHYTRELARVHQQRDELHRQLGG